MPIWALLVYSAAGCFFIYGACRLGLGCIDYLRHHETIKFWIALLGFGLSIYGAHHFVWQVLPLSEKSKQRIDALVVYRQVCEQAPQCQSCETSRDCIVCGSRDSCKLAVDHFIKPCFNEAYDKYNQLSANDLNLHLERCINELDGTRHFRKLTGDF